MAKPDFWKKVSVGKEGSESPKKLDYESIVIVSATRSRRDIKIPLCLSAPVRNFIIVIINHGRTHKCDFSVFYRKYPVWANLAKKIKIFSLSWNLVHRLIRIWRIQWLVFTVSVLDRQQHVLVNLIQNIKNVNLRWNVVLRLILIWKIQRGSSLL